MITYALGALGLIASLAWNDAAKALTVNLFPDSGDKPLGLILYAVLVTFIVVAISFYLSRLFMDEEEVVEEKKDE